MPLVLNGGSKKTPKELVPKGKSPEGKNNDIFRFFCTGGPAFRPVHFRLFILPEPDLHPSQTVLFYSQEDVAGFLKGDGKRSQRKLAPKGQKPEGNNNDAFLIFLPRGGAAAVLTRTD